MTSVLILDVVKVDDVDVLDAKPRGAFVDRAADAPTREVQRVLAVSVGIGVLADLGRHDVAVAGHSAERPAQHGLGARTAVGRRHVEVVDPTGQRGVDRATASCSSTGPNTPPIADAPKLRRETWRCVRPSAGVLHRSQ